MNEHILVEVYVPTAQLYLDVGIATAITIQEVLDLLYSLCLERLNTGQLLTCPTLLYQATIQKALPVNITVLEAGILPGDRLLLF